MKRTFTFLMSLFLMVGTMWADVTDLPQISTVEKPIYYTIVNTRSSQPGGLMYYAGDAVGLKDEQAVVLEAKHKFFFTGSHDAMYIHNAATGKKLASVDSWTEDGAVWAVGVSPKGGGLAFGPKGGLNGNSCWNEKNFATDANTSDFTTWSANDDGSIFIVDLAENYVFPKTDLFYVIESPLFEKVQGVKKAIYVNNEGKAVWGTEDLKNNNFYWIPTVDAKGKTVALKNLGTGTYLSKADGTMTTEAATATLKILGDCSFNINVGGTIHAAGHSSGAGANGTLTDWGGGIGSASAWSFVQKNDPATLKEATVKYSFVYEGQEKFNQTVATFIGEEWPAVTVAFPYGVSAVKPEGVIAEDDVKDGVAAKTIELADNLPFAYAASYEEVSNKGYWYVLKFHSDNKYYLYHKEGQDHISLDKKAVDPNDPDVYAWGFVGDPFNGFKVVNKAAGTGKILSSSTTMSGTTGSDTWPIMTDEATLPKDNNTYWTLYASPHGTNGFFMGQKGIAANKLNDRGKLAYWTGGAGTGSTFQVEIAPVKLTYNLTDALGNEYTGTYMGVAGTDLPVLSGAAGCTFSDVKWNGAAVTAKVAFPFPISSAEITNPLMIGSHKSEAFLWRAEGTGITVLKNATADSDNYKWAIYPAFSEGNFTFTIKNLGTGKYINSTSADNSHAEGAVTLADEGTAFTVEANNKFKLGTGKFLSVNSANDDKVQIVGTWGEHGGVYNKFVAVAVEVASVTLDKTEATLTEAGATVTLVATVAPVNATNKTVTWGSSNTEVATVDANGVVTAVADGKATITATVGDKTATCEVTVAIVVPVTGVTLDKTEATLTEAGATVTLVATVAPENATDKTVTWSTSDDKVATVVDGVVTAVANGKATITAKAGEKTATCEVTVAIPEVDPNDYTSYIKNAAVTSAEGWNIGLGKHEGGLMKYGSGKLVDFNQTITLPAGQYKMTAKAAYRYTGGEQSEYEAIQAGTNTHLAKLYAETATCKYEGNVMNRYEGASDTDYAAGSGSVTVNGKFVPNSSSAVLKWFEAGQYVNEIVFNVQEEGEVKIGIETKETVPGGEYTNISAWTLTRLGDAEADPKVEPEYLTVVGAKVGDVAIDEGKATVESISSFDITFDRPVALAEDAEWAQLTDKWGDNPLKAEVLADNNCVVRFSLQWGQEFTEAGDFYLYIPEGVVVDAENANYINAAIEAVITIEAAPATPLTVTNVTVGEDVMEGFTVVATTEDMIKVNFDGMFYYQGDPTIVDAEGKDALEFFEFGVEESGTSYFFAGKKAGVYTITLAKASFLEYMSYKAPAEDIVLTVTISVVDGIQNINVDADAVIYDIHGRRVEKMTKGLYIVNGRKVMVK